MAASAARIAAVVRASIAVVAVQRRTRNAVACLARLRTVAYIPVIAVEGIVQASADGITAVISAGVAVVAVDRIVLASAARIAAVIRAGITVVAIQLAARVGVSTARVGVSAAWVGVSAAWVR